MEFYRYEYREYATLGIDGEFSSPLFPNPKLELLTLVLCKETVRGYWIGYTNSSTLKWISKTSKKRYAYPSKEQALLNFRLRTERRIRILTHQLDCCKIALSLSEHESIKT